MAEMYRDISIDEFTLPLELLTKSSDGKKVKFKIDVVTRLQDANTLRQKANFSPARVDINHLGLYISAVRELRDIIESEAGQLTIEKLGNDQAAVNQISIKIEGILSQVLQDNGLRFVRIAALKPQPVEGPVTASAAAAANSTGKTKSPPPSLKVKPVKSSESSGGGARPATAGKPGFKLWPVLFGIVTLILVVVLIISGSSSSQNSTKLAEKDKTISTLKKENDAINAASAAQQSQLKIMQDKLNLSLSNLELQETSINQYGGQTSPVASFKAQYAGYVVISAKSSTNGLMNITNQTSAQTFPTSYTFSSESTRVIPVLPGDVTIELKNTSPVNGSTTTVTVTYYY